MMICRHCGMPQVWSTIRERYWCAVYGDHTPRASYHTEPDVLFVRRDMNAPLAAVVDEIAAMPYPTDIRRARKADYIARHLNRPTP